MCVGLCGKEDTPHTKGCCFYKEEIDQEELLFGGQAEVAIMSPRTTFSVEEKFAVFITRRDFLDVADI